MTDSVELREVERLIQVVEDSLRQLSYCCVGRGR